MARNHKKIDREIIEELRAHFVKEKILKNIAKFCRDHDINRMMFYRMKDSYVKNGESGVTAKLIGGRQLKLEIADKIELLALKRPDLTCEMIADEVVDEGGSHCVSTSTVQRLLRNRALSVKLNRLRRIEEIFGDGGHPLHNRLFDSKRETDLLLDHVVKINPRLRLRNKIGRSPGSILAHDVAFLGRFRDQHLYFAVAIDTFSSYAIGTLQDRGNATDGLEYLITVAFPGFVEMGIMVGKILTDNNPRYCGIADKLGVSHDRIRCTPGKHIAYIDYIKSEIKKTFLKPSSKDSPHESLQDLQAAFKDWLCAYNQGVNAGYPNFGRSPEQMIHAYLQEDTVET